VTKGADGKVSFKPIGTGPFKVDGAITPNKVVVTRWDGYRQPSSIYLDRIEFNKIGDDTVRLAGLKSGDLDILDAPPSAQVAMIKQDNTLAYREKPGNIGYIMRFLVNKPPFDNIHVRKAVTEAIDRDAINKVAFFGLATMHTNFEFPTHWGFDPSFKGLPLNLDMAKQELAAGNQPNGFKFSVTGANRNPDLAIMQAMQAQLAKAGIQMDIVPEDSTKSFDSFKSGMYPARMSGGSRDADPIADVDQWYSTSTGNYFGYKDAEVDKQIDIVRTNFDQNARADAMHKLNQLMFVDDPVGVMLGDDVDFKVWNAKLRGMQQTFGYGMQLSRLWWASTPRPGPIPNS
jgi:peptide/nickel transport system substrate-binding protein